MVVESKISVNLWRKFSLESVALLGLTLFVSIVVIPIGILVGNHSWNPFSWPTGLFYCSGFLGILSTFALQIWYGSRHRKMDNLMANNSMPPTADASAD